MQGGTITPMKDMQSKVADAMYRQIQSRGYAAPVDVLMDIGVLAKNKYDDWRAGRISFLEAVCTANLHKLSEIMKEIRNYAARTGLRPSFSSYKHKGKPLRFSKTGNPKIEEAYATHYVLEKKVLKNCTTKPSRSPTGKPDVSRSTVSDRSEEVRAIDSLPG